ncbi:MAG: hypothetical protein V9F06_14845 [Thermomicrobiales bacterium]|jgi:hypothetical protein
MKVDIGNVKLARRDFLKITSASAVTGTLVGASASIQPLPRFGQIAHAATTAAPRVAIGYWDGRLDSSFIDAREVQPARSGATTAHITVTVGCDPSELTGWNGYRSTGLRLDLRPAHDGALDIWRHQAGPVTNTSPLARVDIPLDTEGGLRGWIDYRAADGTATTPFRIGAGGELQSGAYLIMLSRPRSLASVDWSSLRLRAIDGGNALELRDGIGKVVTQPHVIAEVILG